VADSVTGSAVEETAAHNEKVPRHRMADVTRSTVDGRGLGSGAVHARGGPEEPMSRDDVIAKYMEFAAPVLGQGRAVAIRDAILGLMDPDRMFSDLGALIFDAPKPQQID